MEFSLYINQKAAVEWELAIAEATLFSYLINSGIFWMKTLPENPEFRNAASAKLAVELPLICKHEGSARRHMATLEEKGLIERCVVRNKSYFKITEKGFLWKSDTLSRPNETVWPEPKAKRNGLAKPNEMVWPRPNETVRQSDIPTNQINQLSEKDDRDLAAALPTKARHEPKSNAVWSAYSQAYEHRYSSKPKRNQKVNSILCKLVDRLGSDDAPNVAAYYVTSNNRYYVERRHTVDALLSDAEKLFSEWETGTQTTFAQARQIDQTQNNLSVGQRVLEDRRARGLIT